MKRKNNLMWTNSEGYSFYKLGNRYFKNSGFLETEITKEEFIANFGKEKGEN